MNVTVTKATEIVCRNCKIGEVKANLQPGTEWGGRLKARWLTPEPNMAEVVCTRKTSQWP